MDGAFIPALSNLVMSLGDQLPRIEAEIAGAELYGAPRLSAFQLLAPNENALSRVIADLLDCRGSHGQGKLFLNHFLLEATLPTIGPRDTRHVKVTREFLTDNSRRIDIVVETPAAILGVENKPWAEQQDNQLSDYIAYIKRIAGGRRAKLIFISDQKPESATAEVVQISYNVSTGASTTLSSVLSTAMGRVKAERTRDFLQDFMGYIERQFGEGHMAEEYDAPFVRAVSAEFDDGPMKRKAVAAVLLSQQTLHRRLLNEVGIFMKRQVQEKVARDFQTCRLVAPATSAQVQVEDVDLTLQNRWECWGLRRPVWPANCFIAVDSDKGEQRGVYYGVYAPEPAGKETKNFPACAERWRLEQLSESVGTRGSKSEWWPWYKNYEPSSLTPEFLARLVLEAPDGDLTRHPDIQQLAGILVSLGRAVDEAFST